MRENDHSYFCNRSCKYFPCHETKAEDFNCLFFGNLSVSKNKAIFKAEITE